MIPKDADIFELTSAVSRGGVGDLRFACNLADRIVAAVKNAKDEETLREGFQAFRARNDWKEYTDPETGAINDFPLSEDEISAPPSDKTGLGRFNSPKHPVLYLSTTREVALAETRALPSDICTVAVFQTVKPIRIATLLKVEHNYIDIYTNDSPSDEVVERWLLAEAAKFVSRRVPDRDRDLHYRACNLISSALKDSGFEGLAYRSSFWSSGWRDETRSADEDHIFASNIVLFDPGAAVPTHSRLFQIDWSRPKAVQAGNSIWNAKS